MLTKIGNERFGMLSNSAVAVVWINGAAFVYFPKGDALGFSKAATPCNNSGNGGKQ